MILFFRGMDASSTLAYLRGRTSKLHSSASSGKALSLENSVRQRYWRGFPWVPTAHRRRSRPLPSDLFCGWDID